MAKRHHGDLPPLGVTLKEYPPEKLEILQMPLRRGWVRQVVMRNSTTKPEGDVYYFHSSAKLRSGNEVVKYLDDNAISGDLGSTQPLLSREHFSFNWKHRVPGTVFRYSNTFPNPLDAPAPAPAAGTGVHPAPQLVHDASATLGNLSHPRGNSHPVSAAHQARVDPSTLAGTLGEAHRTQGESATDQWVYSGPSTPVGEKVQPPWSSSGTASLSVSKVTLHRRQSLIKTEPKAVLPSPAKSGFSQTAANEREELRLFIEEDKQERHVAMCTYLVLAASGGMLMTELQLLQAVKQRFPDTGSMDVAALLSKNLQERANLFAKHGDMYSLAPNADWQYEDFQGSGRCPPPWQLSAAGQGTGNMGQQERLAPQQKPVATHQAPKRLPKQQQGDQVWRLEKGLRQPTDPPVPDPIPPPNKRPLFAPEYVPRPAYMTQIRPETQSLRDQLFICARPQGFMKFSEARQARPHTNQRHPTSDAQHFKRQSRLLPPPPYMHGPAMATPGAPWPAAGAPYQYATLREGMPMFPQPVRPPRPPMP